MQLALVLEEARKLSIREIEIDETLGAHDVRIAIHTVGICGSDVHYYQHGAIGPFVVREPMVLGHEASGVVIEVGAEVDSLAPGDRVCMEPGIPDANSRASRLGLYNLDPAVQFWATPPVHGVLRPDVVHPAAFTFKLPEPVSFAEGAMVEPLAVGVHAANKARISPGDVAVVTGAGPIGILTALAVLAGGCSKVIISDLQQPKLDLAATLGPIVPVNVSHQDLQEVVRRETEGWGADLLFEATGAAPVLAGAFELLRPGGRMVLIGMPAGPVPLDLVAAQVREISIESVFRYAHVYPRAIDLIAAGKIDLTALITDSYAFADSVKAFDAATEMRPESVKSQIIMPPHPRVASL